MYACAVQDERCMILKLQPSEPQTSCAETISEPADIGSAASILRKNKYMEQRTSSCGGNFHAVLQEKIINVHVPNAATKHGNPGKTCLRDTVSTAMQMCSSRRRHATRRVALVVGWGVEHSWNLALAHCMHESVHARHSQKASTGLFGVRMVGAIYMSACMRVIAKRPAQLCTGLFGGRCMHECMHARHRKKACTGLFGVRMAGAICMSVCMRVIAKRLGQACLVGAVCMSVCMRVTAKMLAQACLVGAVCMNICMRVIEKWLARACMARGWWAQYARLCACASQKNG